jgi:hypothetical protein
VRNGSLPSRQSNDGLSFPCSAAPVFGGADPCIAAKRALLGFAAVALNEG